MRYVLDRHTGEIFLLAQEPAATAVELPGKRAAVENEPERFATVEPVGASVQWEWMREFAVRLDDPVVTQALLDALAGEHPFPSFLSTLREHTEARKQWRRYREERLLATVSAWLAAQGIEAELQPLPR